MDLVGMHHNTRLCILYYELCIMHVRLVLAVKSEVAYLFFDAHFFRFHPYSPWRSQPQPNFHLP